MSKRVKFDEEFRRHAVDMASVSGRPRYQIAADLGISDTTLAKWMKKHRDHQPQAPLTADERAELDQLRAEKRDWAIEREILKRSMALGVKEKHG